MCVHVCVRRWGVGKRHAPGTCVFYWAGFEPEEHSYFLQVCMYGWSSLFTDSVLWICILIITKLTSLEPSCHFYIFSHLIIFVYMCSSMSVCTHLHAVIQCVCAHISSCCVLVSMCTHMHGALLCVTYVHAVLQCVCAHMCMLCSSVYANIYVLWSSVCVYTCTWYTLVCVHTCACCALVYVLIHLHAML